MEADAVEVAVPSRVGTWADVDAVDGRLDVARPVVVAAAKPDHVARRQLLQPAPPVRADHAVLDRLPPFRDLGMPVPMQVQDEHGRPPSLTLTQMHGADE